MTFVNESCFATVPSCTVSGFPNGIHTVMTFALKKQKRLCRRTVLCGQQTGFIPVEENSLVMTFASESGFATMLSCMVNSFKALADGMSYSCICLNKSKL